jgi:4-amino-4-deoxy-L-arabinose transferase-like glycosyltransferase
VLQQGNSARASVARGGSQRAATWMWLIAAALWFLPLNSPHLFDPDEGRYGEIPREMVASGDWVTPRLDAVKYFEKPPLQYWATATTFELFGEHAWTVRLWPALCGFLGLVLTLVSGRRLYGMRAAAFAVIVQASSLLYIAMARIATLDMSLCFTLQLAMAALALLAQRSEPVKANAAAPSSATDAPKAATGGAPLLPMLLGVGVALAVMTKGLVGILIPGAAAVLFMLMYRDARLLLSSRPWWTLAALLLLAAPWFILASVRNPGFARFFFIFEHFQRYLSRTGIERYQPDWFFVPVLLAGLLPWTSALPRALVEALRAARRGERATGLLLIWAAFIFVFFSLSQSKLVPYILPLVPALALLIGRELARWEAPRLRVHLVGIAVGATAVMTAVLVAWRLPAASRLVAQASSISVTALVAAFAALALSAVLGARWCRQGRMLTAVTSVAVGVVCLTQLMLFGADQLPRMQALVTAVQRLRPWVDRSSDFYCVGFYPQPVTFYLRRPCTVVGYEGELEFGLDQQPSHEVAQLPQFAQLWRQQQTASAIITPADYQRLEALGAPMHVIYTAPSLMVVVKSK